MCARVLLLGLAGLFVYLTVTIAAFVYLQWWQAILASLAVFAAMVLAVKVLIKSAIGNVAGLAKGLFDVKARVLRGATVQVHSVRRAKPPADYDAPDADDPAEAVPLDWHQVEATVFPDPRAAGPTHLWEATDLRLVPFDAPPASLADDDETERPESELYDLRVVVDGEPREPSGEELDGPQRLRFVAGLPRGVREAKFQYYLETFGRVPLASPALPGG